MKKYYSYFFRLFISALIVFFLLKKIPFSSVLDVFAKIDFFYLFIGTFLFVFCWFVNSKKWFVLLKYFGIDRSLSLLFKLNLISIFYSSVLPGGQITGEMIKCAKIVHNSEEKMKMIFSVIIDRITGLNSIVLLGFVGILFTKSVFLLSDKIFLFFLAALFFVSSFYVMNSNGVYALFQRSVFFFPEKIRFWTKKVIDVVFSYHGAWKVLFFASLIGILFQALNSLSVLLLAKSIGLNIGFLDLLWINALISILLVVPVTVLGLGLREGSFVFFLGMLGYSGQDALGLSFVVSAIYLFTGLIGGIIELYEQFFSSSKEA